MTSQIKERKFIAIDLGAESGRCCVGILLGNKLDLAEVHRFPTHSIKYDFGFHWDILLVYHEILLGLTKAKEVFGDEFESISIDSWAVDYVLIDSDGRLLGYPYHYRDERTEGIMENVFKIVPKDKLYKITGTQFAQFNTLFQFMSEKERSLNLLKLADKMLLIPDYFNFLLTGKKLAECTNASTTGLFDPYKRLWAWDLIDIFDIPRKIFPPLINPGSKLGTILPSIAKQTGLKNSIEVIAGASHDTASAVVSIPNLTDSSGFLCTGTWSLMGVELSEPILTNAAMENNFTNEGGYEHSIRFLKNIIGLWPIQQCKQVWQKIKDYSYSDLVSLAVQSGPSNTWIDLNEPRFMSGDDIPSKILSFMKETGQSATEDIGFITRVIFESLAFNYRQTLDEIEKVTGRKIDRLRAVGGGTLNTLLMQLTADALNRQVIAGPVEGAIVGNIGVQGIASKYIENLKALKRIIENSFPLIKYTPKNPDYFFRNERTYQNILN
jgi:rhamnulokinase